MAKKTKAEREAEAAAAKLAEQKKNDLTLGTVDNTAINKAAPTTVQSNIKPDEGVVINNNKWNAGELINNPVGFRNQLDIAQQEREKPKTVQDLFNQHKQAAIKDKTDAQKMQQYYALTDVLKTLGQMGGGIVGGAIGGSITDNMPNIGEYKESRGYLDAFERAKQANDRLRQLDDKEFQLRYQDEMADKEAERRAKERALDQQWQMTFFDYKTKIEQAIADKNLAAQQKYQKELMDAKQEYEKELITLRGEYDLKGRRISAYSGRGGGGGGAPKPDTQTIDFEDGTTVDVTNDQYRRIRNRFIGRTFGPEDEKVTDQNLPVFIRQNPDEIKQFLGIEKPTNVNKNYISSSNPDDSDMDMWKGRGSSNNKPNLPNPNLGITEEHIDYWTGATPETQQSGSPSNNKKEEVDYSKFKRGKK